MNFLVVISKFPPEYSGPGVRVPKLYNWLMQEYEGATVQVICNSVEHQRSSEYFFQGLPVHRVVSTFVRLLLINNRLFSQRVKDNVLYQCDFLKTLWYLCSSPKYKETTILHVAGHSGGTAAAIFWAQKRKIPILMELVNAQASPIQRAFLWNKIYPSNAYIIAALNTKLVENCVSLGFEPSRIWLKPNPVNKKRFFVPSPKEKNKYRESISRFSQSDIVIASVGKIIPRKNQLFLIEVLKGLPDHFKLLIAGPIVEKGPNLERDSKYVQEIKQSIISKGLEERVTLKVGFVESDHYMKASDIYAIPAWDEGLGTPMLEALGCGIPVVANKDEQAFCDIIEDNYNGCLCDLTNVESWVEAFKNLSKTTHKKRLKLSEDLSIIASQDIIYSNYRNYIDKLSSESFIK